MDTADYTARKSVADIVKPCLAFHGAAVAACAVQDDQNAGIGGQVRARIDEHKSLGERNGRRRASRGDGLWRKHAEDEGE